HRSLTATAATVRLRLRLPLGDRLPFILASRPSQPTKVTQPETPGASSSGVHSTPAQCMLFTHKFRFC
ncbi:hypothetical protein LSAT2_022311, partial [Lamellibrachia satsuma]